MDRKDIAVVLTGEAAPEALISDLKREGFGTVLDAHALTVRDALSKVLKTGASGIITLQPDDGSGVHDAVLAADALQQNPDKLICCAPQEPEKATKPEKLYAFLSGVDSATALTSVFGMSRDTAETMIRMKSRDGTFFMNMPLEARIHAIPVLNVPTEKKVPAPGGKQLLGQSFKLYLVFIKFSIAALIAYLVDIGTFFLFEIWLNKLDDSAQILISTVLSRALCSLTTYLLNKKAVFSAAATNRGTIIRFIILSVIQLIFSWLLVWGIGSLFRGNEFVNMLLKVVVDLGIFLGSFTILRDWVFGEKKEVLH